MDTVTDKIKELFKKYATIEDGESFLTFDDFKDALEELAREEQKPEAPLIKIDKTPEGDYTAWRRFDEGVANFLVHDDGKSGAFSYISTKTGKEDLLVYLPIENEKGEEQKPDNKEVYKEQVLAVIKENYEATRHGLAPEDKDRPASDLVNEVYEDLYSIILHCELTREEQKPEESQPSFKEQIQSTDQLRLHEKIALELKSEQLQPQQSKEEQKKLIIDIMHKDEDAGLYDTDKGEPTKK